MFFSSLIFLFRPANLILSHLLLRSESFFKQILIFLFSEKYDLYLFYFPRFCIAPVLVLVHHLANVTGLPKTGL
jgi:hypothetical protein